MLKLVLELIQNGLNVRGLLAKMLKKNEEMKSFALSWIKKLWNWTVHD